MSNHAHSSLTLCLCSSIALYLLATCSWQAASTKDITSHSSCNRPKLATFLTLQIWTGQSDVSAFKSEHCKLGRKHGRHKASHHIVELVQDNVHPCAWAVAHNRSIEEQHLIESCRYLHFLSFSNVEMSLKTAKTSMLRLRVYPELFALWILFEDEPNDGYESYAMRQNRMQPHGGQLMMTTQITSKALRLRGENLMACFRRCTWWLVWHNGVRIWKAGASPQE